MEKNKKIKIIVKAENNVLKLLQEEITFMSKNNIKSAFTRGQIIVNNKLAKPNQIVTKGDVIVIDRSKKVIFKSGVNLKLDIIFENNEIIVVNKPSGLLTVGNDKEKIKTLYHAVTDYVKEENVNNRIFIVHRLDKDTSGVVLFAKNENLKHVLQDKWNKLVKKREYIAVVEGKVSPKRNTITTWLLETKTRLVYSSSKPGDGKEAITEYEVLNQNKEFALVKLNLQTGRKNQIRVHMSEMGNPVTGDKMYHALKNPLKRLALHASSLEIEHPFTKKIMVFSKEVPNTFLKLF